MKPNPTRIFALTTRGLESLSAAEIAALPHVRVDGIAYRRVTATCAGDLAPFLTLRTVDDVFLDVATWHNLVRQRVALSALEQQAAQLDLRPAVTLHFQNVLRGWATPRPRFAITVSFVGKRNYSTDEIKQRVATAISAQHPWVYEADDADADFNLRIFMEHATAYVGVRLGNTPLHRRGYKHAHVRGSLKPPVAFALLALADVAPGELLLDPCCGAGTVLIEGVHSGAHALGGDLSTHALTAAQANAQAACAAVSLRRWDAGRLPLASHSVDIIVSNPPWGRAVDVGVDVAAFYRRLCAELRRVLRPGGRIALLTSVPDLVHFPKMYLETQLEVSLFGQNPVILVFA